MQRLRFFLLRPLLEPEGFDIPQNVLRQFHDESFAQLRLIVTNLSDAMVVQSVLERKQSEAIVEGESRQDRLDARVDKLVSSIGELIRRIPPENLKP